MLSPRARAWLTHPVLWVAVIYLAGVALRLQYSLRVQPPESLVSSDMSLYVQLAQRPQVSARTKSPAESGINRLPAGSSAMAAGSLR